MRIEDAEAIQSVRVKPSIDIEAVAPLEIANSGFHFRSHDAVNRAVVETLLLELPLRRLDIRLGNGGTRI